MGFDKALVSFIIVVPPISDIDPYLQPHTCKTDIDNADVDLLHSTSSIKLPKRHLSGSATLSDI